MPAISIVSALCTSGPARLAQFSISGHQLGKLRPSRREQVQLLSKSYPVQGSQEPSPGCMLNGMAQLVMKGAKE